METQTKAEKKAELRKKKAVSIKERAEQLFKAAFPEYIAFFFQNQNVSPNDRKDMVINLAERSIEFSEEFHNAWARKKGKYLAPE